MTEMLTGTGTVKSTQTGSLQASARVLDVLNRISEGSIESTEEISAVYGDAAELVKRAEEKAAMFAELGLEISPYVAHLDKLAQIENNH